MQRLRLPLKPLNPRLLALAEAKTQLRAAYNCPLGDGAHDEDLSAALRLVEQELRHLKALWAEDRLVRRHLPELFAQPSPFVIDRCEALTAACSALLAFCKAKGDDGHDPEEVQFQLADVQSQLSAAKRLHKKSGA